MCAAIVERTTRIVEVLRPLDDDALLAPSVLPGWSRLTIACHLRYGADAFCRMTHAALAGEPAAYYPEGRDSQRARTLRPDSDESPSNVVSSLARHSEVLAQTWESLDGDAWKLETTEPEDNQDLGPRQVSQLPLMRLTEVEVHGSDLGVGLDRWSEVFVRLALPFRLEWLNTRRANHRSVDERVEGSWLLVASDGPTYRVSVTGAVVESVPSAPTAPARAVIEGTRRDLLALLLGRPANTQPRVSGDIAFGHAFTRAFPGP